MRWSRVIQTVDVHCEGEIGRVIVGGVLDIPGNTMGEKLAHLNEVDDSLRRFLCSEPRSGPAGSFVLLTPACTPGADVGMIVLQPDQAHAMSGSNAMCAVTAILETGMLPMSGEKTLVTLDTAVGLVRGTATCRDGKVECVSLDMPAAFVAKAQQVINTPRWGQVTYDLCFGGVFYALVDVDQIGMDILPENARDLATSGVELRELIAAETDIAHPLVPDVRGLAYVMFRKQLDNGVLQTCTTLRPGRADRSPCGTGSNASMAVRYASGQAQIGDVLTTRSIIGGEFETRLRGTEEVGSYDAVLTTISGRCWIYAMTQIGLDPTDPFPHGFILSDTWGGSATDAQVADA